MLSAETLKSFYETETGKLVCQILRERITKLCGISHGEKIAGYGFAYPYLPLFMGYNTCVAFYPSSNGDLKTDGVENIAVEENSLPAHNDVYDKIICVHGAESSNKLPKLIEEFWRVLAPNGKLILITANQDSFWRKSKTPFASGMSYTKNQLISVVMHNKFLVRYTGRAVFFHPSLALQLAKFVDYVGNKLWNKNGAVNLIVAQKMIFAPRGRKLRAYPSFLDKLFKPKPVTARDNNS